MDDCEPFFLRDLADMLILLFILGTLLAVDLYFYDKNMIVIRIDGNSGVV